MMDMVFSKITARIYSISKKIWYNINSIVEHIVDLDLTVDADQLNIVIHNPGGIYSGLFHDFDLINLYIDSKQILHGIIDDMEYSGSPTDGDNVINLVARDLTGVLIDNDALPRTLHNVKPYDYIVNKFTEYGIARYSIDKALTRHSELTISAGQSELDVISSMISRDNKRLWTLNDTIYVGNWAYGAKPVHYFTRGVTSVDGIPGIPYENVKYRVVSTQIASEYRLYSSVNGGKDKVIGIAYDDRLVALGVKRRKVLSSSDDANLYKSQSLFAIEDNYRNSMTVIITLPFIMAIVPNTTAYIIDRPLKLEGVYFIRKARYTKNAVSGGTVEVTMVPGDPTFDEKWRYVSK